MAGVDQRRRFVDVPAHARRRRARAPARRRGRRPTAGRWRPRAAGWRALAPVARGDRTRTSASSARARAAAVESREAAQLGLEHAHERLVVPARAERRLEPLLLEVALGAGFDRALEDLLGAVALAVALGDGAELEEHLAARDRSRRDLAAPPRGGAGRRAARGSSSRRDRAARRRARAPPAPAGSRGSAGRRASRCRARRARARGCPSRAAGERSGSGPARAPWAAGRRRRRSSPAGWRAPRRSGARSRARRRGRAARPDRPGARSLACSSSGMAASGSPQRSAWRRAASSRRAIRVALSGACAAAPATSRASFGHALCSR